jgi:hypothetical protein
VFDGCYFDLRIRKAATDTDLETDLLRTGAIRGTMATTNTNATSAKTDTPKTAGTAKAAKAPKVSDSAQASTEQPVSITRLVVVPIGAGLVVRDDVVSSLRKLSKKYTTSAGIEKELTRYEKRGNRVRNRLEKQVKRQRTQFEREMRARRKRFEDQATGIGKRFEAPASAVSKRVDGPVHAVKPKVDGLTSRLEELVSQTHGLIS